MPKREHHAAIVKVLESLNGTLLAEMQCYFGGGTAISLLIDEFRESVDIDFLCADAPGYSRLRGIVFDHGIQGLFSAPVTLLRETRADRDGVRTVLEVDGRPIKFEIVREANISLTSDAVLHGVPVLSRESLFAEKLLANADRYGDKTALSKDILDLVVMEHAWGAIPEASMRIAKGAYASGVEESLLRAKTLLAMDDAYRLRVFERMAISEEYRNIVEAALLPFRRRRPPSPGCP